MTAQVQVFFMFAVNLIVIIAGIGKGVGVLLSIRDEILGMKLAIGTKDPPDGLLGDVRGLQREARAQRDSLIEITSELNLRPPGGRS